jgi:hypothetical protein
MLQGRIMGLMFPRTWSITLVLLENTVKEGLLFQIVQPGLTTLLKEGSRLVIVYKLQLATTLQQGQLSSLAQNVLLDTTV